MGGYLPVTDRQRDEMLRAVGAPNLWALYEDVPESIRLTDGLQLENGIPELELTERVTALSERNRAFRAIFRGAGAYKHFIPAIVSRVSQKERFLTAYTPYQPEISQGVLQSIFEFQTMISELTGLPAANASVYDGAVAAAEAVGMCVDKKKRRALISSAIHPEVLEVVRTYCVGAGTELVPVPASNGKTDLAALSQFVSDECACFYYQYPNFNGILEDADEIERIVHGAGAKLIMGVNPIAISLLRSPAECGADIAVGDGQMLGMPLSFGGPTLGFMAAKTELLRKLPGRIVGETVDASGERCFVLTLQAREQHIRREKASSNICSNQALCALTAAAYMAAMGPSGMAQAAKNCYSKAHYLSRALSALPGFYLLYPDAPFFHEFVTSCPVPKGRLLSALEEKGILGGLPVDGGILWCATECNSAEQIDALLTAIKEVM